jgi:hypothetical protein
MTDYVATDTKLAVLYNQIAEHRFDIAEAQRTLDQEARYVGLYQGEYLAKAKKAVLVARASIEVLEAHALPGERAWFTERWARYYLVDNTGGHVHRSTGCSTCFPTTRFYWLTEHSGITAEELVELAGEEACTVCFPDAPVSALSRPSLLTTPEREAKAREREERATKSAQLAIKREANAITNPDGSVIRFDKWHRIDTVNQAWMELTDAHVSIACYKRNGLEHYREGIVEEYEAKAEVLLTALTHKLGADTAGVFAKKLHAKMKREGLS